MEEPISLVFTSDNIGLVDMPFKKLSEFVEDFFKILPEVKDSGLSQADTFDLKYSLVGIEVGSVKLVFNEIGSAGLRENYYEFVNHISENRAEQLPTKAKKRTFDLVKKLQTFDPSLAIQLFTSAGVPISINSDHFVMKPVLYQNTETFYGELTDVGGSNDINVHIKTKNGSLTCDVTKEQAIELASRLYSVVGLVCDVTRELNEEKPIKIVVSEILPYDETKWDNNIARLRELFSERFKNIDPEEYFRALRS